MPRIEVYKGNGSVIPITLAKKSKAFQCPFTKKIFTSKKNYIEHLAKRRQNNIDNIRVENSKKILLKSLYNSESFSDIITWIESHPSFFYYNAIHGESKNDISRQFWIEILELNLKWKDNISNSHCCPHNGVTNWSRNEKFKDGSLKPLGYSGWSGTFTYRISHDVGFGSSLFLGSRINLGGGGGDPKKSASYEVKFFDADWPNITKNVEQILIQNALLDEYSIPSFVYKK